MRTGLRVRVSGLFFSPYRTLLACNQAEDGFRTPNLLVNICRVSAIDIAVESLVRLVFGSGTAISQVVELRGVTDYYDGDVRYMTEGIYCASVGKLPVPEGYKWIHSYEELRPSLVTREVFPDLFLGQQLYIRAQRTAKDKKVIAEKRVLMPEDIAAFYASPVLALEMRDQQEAAR